MNELTPFLETLAAKLGTTTQYLWGVLVKQAAISGVADCFWAVFFLVVSILSAWAARWLIKNDSGEDGLVLFCGAAAIIAFVIAGANVYFAVTALVNPEYWALKEILSAVKK
jgi:hypothetical protein